MEPQRQRGVLPCPQMPGLQSTRSLTSRGHREAVGDPAALLLKDLLCPGWAAPLAGAFSPLWGHVPRLQVQSPIGA